MKLNKPAETTGNHKVLRSFRRWAKGGEISRI